MTTSKKKTSGKGVADIDLTRLALLHSATVQTHTLTECLASDFALLLSHVLPELGGPAVRRLQDEATTGITRRMVLAATVILEHTGQQALAHLQNHPSDMARGWACYLIGAQELLSFSERLTLIAPLADDAHFGVWEWAWLALRPYIAQELDQAILLLSPWTASLSEYQRRFACDAIRPRGVWCAHLTRLKEQPSLALPILERPDHLCTRLCRQLAQ